MAYCSECGAEISSTAKFCPECGASLNTGESDTGSGETVAATGKSPEPTEFEDESEEGRNWKMVVVGAVLGLLIGAFAAWATINIGSIAGIAFFVGWVGGGYYVYQKPSISAGIGSGLYITALLMILTPLLFYIPNVLGENDGTATGAGQFIGSILGLAIWGFVFFLFALVTAGIGYYFQRRAEKQAETA